MERRIFLRNAAVKRVLCYLLIFAVVVTTGTFSRLGDTVAKADGGSKLTVHFRNEKGWETVNAKFGSGSNWDPIAGYEDAKNNEFGVPVAEGVNTGWHSYQVLLPEGITEVQGLFNNGAWGGDNQTGNYAISISGDKEVWITYESGSTNVKVEETAPANWLHMLTIHFYNEKNWETVNAKYGAGSSWAAIPGYEDVMASEFGLPVAKDASHEGWYTFRIGLDDSITEVQGLFNNGAWGDANQTGNFAAAVSGDTECFITFTDAAAGKDIGVAYTAPASWTNPSQGEGEGGDDEKPGESAGINVSDRVQIKVGDKTAEMLLYANGVYEAALSLEPGSYEAQALVNGEAYADKASVTVETAGTVYFRIKDGKLTDSVNGKGLVHSAAFTGNFTGLEFVDDAGTGYEIAGWAPADPNAELTYIGGGLYKRTFRFQELAADLAIADGGYKIAFDDGWDYSIGNGSDNIAITIPAGRTSFTIFVDEIGKTVYDDVRTADFEVAQTTGAIMKNALNVTVSFIGDARGGNDWDAAAKGYEFTQISETLFRYQKVFAAGTYNYKCVFDYESWYEAEAGNRGLNVAANDTNVVFLYNTADGKLYDTLNNADKTAELLGMKAAPAEMEVIDNANGTTKFIALAESGAEVTLYYGNKADVEANGAQALKTAAMSAAEGGAYHSDNLFFGDEALDLVYYYDINGTRTLDASNETVTAGGAEYSNYKRAAFTGRNVYVPGTFPGPSWDAASNQMEYQGGGLYAFTFNKVPAANYEFKVAIGGTWAENYGKDGIPDGSNYAVAVPNAQDVTVYYNDFSHRAVTSVDYVFADIDLAGTGIPSGTKMTDEGLTGIYTAAVKLAAGTYSDVKIIYNGEEFIFNPFTISTERDVTFFFDPDSGIKYHNASDEKVETEHIYYDSKDAVYKSVYGALATGEKAVFSLATGTDAEEVLLIFKGREKKNLAMAKSGATADGVQMWSAEVSFDTIGEYTYYFAVSNGSSISIYADDDGYYGTGTVTDLTSIKPYDLVVYKSGYKTPDWMKNAVIYQIFPDRFFDGDESNNKDQVSARGEVDYEYITDWYTLPENPEQEDLLTEEEYKATGAHYGDRNWSNEIYGGDLKGITERIDYLKALGVNVIYLNPVFASISSHRYDTSDYMMIDPILGDLGDFTELAKVAEENNMHIILDGVFNHVSDDSIYFDRYYKYLEKGTDIIGAYPYWAFVYDYMTEKSAGLEAAEAAAKEYFTKEYGIKDYSYTEWFDVFTTYLSDGTEPVKDNIGLRAGKPVYGYDGWWGYDSMPIIKATNGSEYQTGNWAEEIIYNEEGTSVTQYWLSEGSDGWRLDVANEVSDETWQRFRDSVKALDSEAVIIGEIWDDATEYLLGDMYDSVMNYVFRNAVTSFAKGGSAKDALNTLEKIRERYPKEAFYAMMNLVSSHDTTRLLSYLDGIDDDRNQKDIDSAFPTYAKTSDLAKKRQYLVALLQFTYAGAPTIYYGDEIGMVGADDPDDRRAFEWGKGNEALVTWYATLANIRANYSALRTGSLEVFDAGNDNVMAFVRKDDSDELVVLANNSESEQQIAVNLSELGVSASALSDLVGGSVYTAADGIVTVTVPALSGAILTADAKKAEVDKKALSPAFDSSYAIAERSPNPPAKPEPDDKPEEKPEEKPDGKPDENPGDDNGGDNNGGSGNNGQGNQTQTVNGTVNSSTVQQTTVQSAKTSDAAGSVTNLSFLLLLVGGCVLGAAYKKRRAR